MPGWLADWLAGWLADWLAGCGDEADKRQAGRLSSGVSACSLDSIMLPWRNREIGTEIHRGLIVYIPSKMSIISLMPS